MPTAPPPQPPAKSVPWERGRPRGAGSESAARRLPSTATRYELSGRPRLWADGRHGDGGGQTPLAEATSHVETEGSRHTEPSDPVPPADPVSSASTAVPVSTGRPESGCGDELAALRAAVERLTAHNGTLRDELDAQIKTSADLRRTLLAAAGDDLQSHVAALWNDRQRLAGNIDRISTEATRCTEAAGLLLIDRDVWRTKFLAASIQSDELAAWRVYLVRQLEWCQRTVHSLVSTMQSGRAVDRRLGADLDALAHMRPAMWLADGGASVCDESGGGRRPVPQPQQHEDPHCRYRNITVTCCTRCAKNDIKLL